jgi:hypothetical protein
MIIIKLIWAKSTELNYSRTRTKACHVEQVVGSPLLYKWRYSSVSRDKYFEYLNEKRPRGPRIYTRFRDNANILNCCRHFLSITRLLGLMLGLFKPDGIEFG